MCSNVLACDVMSLYVKMAITWPNWVSLLEYRMTCCMLMLIYACTMY